jgi:hypothetical protein
MTWQADWLKWTHVTYSLIQSVTLAEKLELGNLSKLQGNIEHANCWFSSDIGFTSVAERRDMAPGSIHLKPNDSERLLKLLRPAVLQMILLTTVSITEAILCEQFGMLYGASKRPTSLRQGLDLLAKHLKGNGRDIKNAWAIQAMHEARILRNCVAHGAGVWSEEAVRQFDEQFKNACTTPVIGQPFTIGVDDIFAYRRAAKTVLNEAARLNTPSADASRVRAHKSKVRS